MKLILAGLVLVMAVGAQACWPIEFARGAKDMWRAYSDMKEANWIGADKYFHCRGNRDAASRGPGGKKAAEMISNSREWIQGIDWCKGSSGCGKEDSEADQEANLHGRSGGDCSKYRPAGLPSKY